MIKSFGWILKSVLRGVSWGLKGYQSTPLSPLKNGFHYK
ncbi:hypothetical protein HPHPH34_0411 [Helicobacter pylori Hp H-34]|uniref:Uncharacterized protein n=1 Tax=Helicobacter pylori Hp H-34 TaxID=992069 RepID=I9VVX4_HELPX|nr:hypothetical protein HPHPH34_0411 [Helicobacter pylori Hp H-34]